MSEISEIRLAGLEEFLKDIDRLGRLDERAWRPVHDAISESVQRIEARAKENLTPDHVAFGHLRASIGSEVRVEPAEVVGEVGTNLGAVAGGKLVGYAQAVEYGSRPHWPPLAPLVEWVRVKQIARGPGAVKIARAVQATIARKGTQPHPFFHPAVDDSLDEIESLLKRAVDDVIANFNRG